MIRTGQTLTRLVWMKIILKILKLKLVAGKFLLLEAGDLNKNHLVISEKTVEALHFESAADAVGQEVIQEQQDSSHFTIIGVVKNYNHQLLMEQMAPLALLYDPSDFKLLQVKYTGF
jgi:putative ABC transport system permease protein